MENKDNTMPAAYDPDTKVEIASEEVVYEQRRQKLIQLQTRIEHASKDNVMGRMIDLTGYSKSAILSFLRDPGESNKGSCKHISNTLDKLLDAYKNLHEKHLELELKERHIRGYQNRVGILHQRIEDMQANRDIIDDVVRVCREERAGDGFKQSPKPFFVDRETQEDTLPDKQPRTIVLHGDKKSLEKLEFVASANELEQVTLVGWHGSADKIRDLQRYVDHADVRSTIV